MKHEQARDVVDDLRDRLGDDWKVKPPEREVQKLSATVNWTVSIVQRGALSESFRVPDSVLDIAHAHNLFLDVDTSEDRGTITLDNHHVDQLDTTADKLDHEELFVAIQHEFDVSQDAAASLAKAYNSVGEILSADREELTDVDGVGDKRASKLLHRRSEAVQRRLDRMDGADVLPVIEDEDGVLRLPEEFEDDKHTPRRPGES